MSEPITASASDHCLTLNAFGVAFNGCAVLRDVTLTLASRGLTVLVGPTGTGKSTLLRAICGYHRSVPSVTTWGECRYVGRPLGADDRWPALVVQHARLLSSTLLDNLLFELPERFASSPEQKRERALRMLADIGLSDFAAELHEPVLKLPLHAQRLISIARLAATTEPLLCVDEPTYGVAAEDVASILDYLRRESTRRAVIVVLHNQHEMRRLDGRLALLASGIVQEVQPIDRFFAQPASAAGRQFIDTGSCAEISPAAKPEDLEPDQHPVASVRSTPPSTRSASVGPNGFVWLLPGRLAGTPQPGIVLDLDYDLDALRRVGVTVLLSLTEQPPDVERLARFGMSSLWHPIPDMEAPSITAAMDLCARIDQLLARNEVIAVHCKAGLGRTGTVLVAYLIWRGETALAALEAARRCESRWVQSDAQIRFLEVFSSALGHRGTASAIGLDSLENGQRRRDSLVNPKELNYVD